MPTLPGILVQRPALLERLTTGAQGPLTFVSGPAGAGKSLLTAHWITQRAGALRAVWLRLEPGDAPEAFWAHVLEGLHRQGIALSDADRPMRAGEDGRRWLGGLAEALGRSPEPVVLVLDQFDALTSPDLADDLAFVIRHASPGLRLVVTGRSEPLLPLHRYRATGEITEIRNSDLRFTLADTEVLLRNHGLAIREEDLQALAERTEGWAAGLRLCALAMQRANDPQAFVREFAADHSTVADYLLAEVLQAYPPATQSLLLRVSITDRIHPDLADVLTGHRDGAWTLAALARANAFLESVDSTGWYRMHPLFAEVLRAHLRHRHPGLEPRLRQRTAQWLADHGQLTEAVAQAAAAHDWQFAARWLVTTLGIGSLVSGTDSDRLRRLLSAIPPGLPGAEPALVEAALRLAEDDLDACAAALARVEGQPGASDPAAAHCRALLAVLAGRLSGDYPGARRAAADAGRLAREVPQRILRQHPELEAMVPVGLGSTALTAGELDLARAGLAEGVEACGPPGTEQPHCEALGSLALVDLLQGRLRQAEAHAHGSLDVAGRSVVPPGRSAALGHLVLAGVATEHDDLAAARTSLNQAVTCAGVQPDSVAAVEAAVIGSRIAAAAGECDRAHALLDEARAHLATGTAPAWELDELAVATSAVHLAEGDTRAALATLEAVACERPQHTVARARVLLAAGRDGLAMEALTGLPADGRSVPQSRVQACLLRAQAAVGNGEAKSARRLLAQALALARPERLRRLFIESGSEVRLLLRQDPQLAWAHSWLPPELLPDNGHRRTAERLPAVVESLSGRERDVLNQAAHMLSTEEIAAELFLSVNTVKTHLKSAFRKLGVTRRGEAVHRAQGLGLL